MPQTQTKRVSFSHTLHIQATPDEVFPLLCPVREHDWIQGWNGQLIYSESGYVEDNCIFESDMPGRGREVWSVSRYEPDRYILEFVRMNLDMAVTKLNIALRETEAGETELDWTEVITALNPESGCPEGTEQDTGLGGSRNEGRALLDTVDEDVYAQRMAHLSTILNHYCTTGEMLRAG